MTTLTSPAPPDGDDTPDVEIGLDDLTEVLSNERRRVVIECLDEREEITVGELSCHLAHNELGTDPSSQERKRFYIALHQTHLPVMDEKNVIEYDVDRKEVRRGSNFNGVRFVMDGLQTYVSG